MRSRRNARRVCAGALAALGVGLLGSAPIALRTPIQPFSCFGSQPADPDALSRYRVVIWHNDAELRGLLQALKRRNPSVQGLMYRELCCVAESEGRLGETLGAYAWIDAQHPDWFQRDAQGRRVPIPDYPGRWLMDAGHPGWRAFWIAGTLRDVIEGGWDGVFADDALTSTRGHRLPPLAGYPTDQALQDAVAGLLAAATAAFRREGKQVIANASNTYDYPGLWERWLELTDGLMEEHFAGEGWTWGPDVASRQMQAMQEAGRRGKRMLCLTYGGWDDAQRMETSLAAYLVGSSPTTYWSYRPAESPDDAAWHPSWATQLGDAREPARLEARVWQRRFERGVAAVNLDGRARAIEGPCGRVRLAPRQGRVLLDGCADSAAVHTGARAPGM